MTPIKSPMPDAERAAGSLHRDCSPAPDHQCDDCQWNWQYMGASEGGHCYMFRNRVEDCYKRRPVQENEKVSESGWPERIKCQ